MTRLYTANVFLATLCFALILPLYVSSADSDGSGPSSLNCTVDADCPANWTCEKDPLSACISFPYHTSSSSNCFNASALHAPPACVRAPDVPSYFNVGFQSIRFFDNSVQVILNWGGPIYPFSVQVGFQFLYWNDWNQGTHRFYAFGSDQIFEKVIPGLKGSSNYSVYMILASAAGSSPLYGPLNFTTIANPPGKVTNVKVVQGTKNSTQLYMTFKCPDNLGAKITEIFVETTQYDSILGISRTEFWTANVGLCLNHINVTPYWGIAVGQRYTFKVKLKNEKDYVGKYSSPVSLTVKGIVQDDAAVPDSNYGYNTGINAGLVVVGFIGTVTIITCVKEVLSMSYRRYRRQHQWTVTPDLMPTSGRVGKY